MLKLILGETFAFLRKKGGLTQKQVAKEVGISLKYLGEVERGEANVSVDVIERLAKLFGWSPWRLFSASPHPISEDLHQLLSKELALLGERLSALVTLLHALLPSRRVAGEPAPTLDDAREDHSKDNLRLYLSSVQDVLVRAITRLDEEASLDGDGRLLAARHSAAELRWTTGDVAAVAATPGGAMGPIDMTPVVAKKQRRNSRVASRPNGLFEQAPDVTEPLSIEGPPRRGRGRPRKNKGPRPPSSLR